MQPVDGSSRRQFLRMLALAAAGSALPAGVAMGATGCQAPWPEWRNFVRTHVESDGRVVDFVNADLRSTSESQSYALFFALVDNDQVLFDRVLAWTRRHLSAGRPDLRLPAWLWGKGGDGNWRVLDDNTASDGELWIAYALLEAGRLWKRPGLVASARHILALMRTAEIADLPGLGPMLLPGKQGFAHPDRWTLNPSYLPLFVLRRFAVFDPRGPWARLAERAVRLTSESSPAGFAPDWIAWNGKAFVVDPEKGDTGSYDAIRCYLWAGMTDSRDPARQRLLQALSGPQALLRAQQRMPEKIQTRRGVGTGNAPAAFSAALLPYLAANGQSALLRGELARLPANGGSNYYERALVLFGKGWHDQRFRFSADGRLLPAWSTACSARN